MANQQLTPRSNRLESNILIDGGMEIWPEGTSRSVINNSSAYGAVLFRLGNTSTGITLTNSQQSAIPSNTNLSFSNQVSKTASGSVSSGTISKLQYVVEGYDISRIFKNDFSIIFWVKSSVASNRSLALRNDATTHSYVRQYNIAQANTWELKALSFPALNTCPGTLERTSGRGLLVDFNIVSGSTFQTATLNQWISGSFFSGNGEDTTWLTGTTHDFSIAGVMLLPGDWTSLQSNTSAYNFIRAGRHFEEEIAKSQKYLEMSYAYGVTPGTNTSNGAAWFVSPRTVAPVAGFANLFTPYKVTKRATPTVTIYSRTGASGNVRDESGGVDVVATIDGGTNANGHGTNFSITDTRYYSWHFVADARF